MAGPVDQEMNAIERIVCYTHRSLHEEGACHPTRVGVPGSTSVSQEADGVGGECEQQPLLWFPREETG